MASQSKKEMLSFPWEERYAVHVPVIDAQHKQIFRDINALVDLLGAKPTVGDIETIVDDMIDYVANHFATEEGLLSRHPDFASHQAKHRGYVERTLEFDRELFASKPEEMAIDLFLFLGAWLRNHILTEDQLYFDYLRNNALLPPP